MSLKLYCVRVIKHVAVFTICAKLSMAFTFTSLPWNIYTSVSGYGLKQFKAWVRNVFVLPS